MGDLHVNGVVFGEDRPCWTSPPSPPLPTSNPDPSSVAPDAWTVAEISTAQILGRIRPTLAADRRRRDVVDYVQRLIRFGARCEVIFFSLFISSILVNYFNCRWWRRRRFGFVFVFLFVFVEFNFIESCFKDRAC